MDSNISQTYENNNSNYENETNKHKQETDETLVEVCNQIKQLKQEDDGDTGSGNSTDSEDLVNAINYNTITSLAALKDILQGDDNDTAEADSFFQHYFMNHCNSLSSRNVTTATPFPFTERRRLSQCREEDEDDDKKEFDPTPSIATFDEFTDEALPSSFGPIYNEVLEITEDKEEPSNAEAKSDEDSKNKDSTKRTVVGEKHKFLVTSIKPPSSPLEKALRAQVHNSHTVHFGTKGPEEQRPNVRTIFSGQNLHRDKNYFDSSLVEIRSSVDGIAASSEDIWVKRADTKPVAKKKELSTSDVDKKLKIDDHATEKSGGERPRAGTWGSHSARKEAISRSARKNKDALKKDSNDRRQKKEQRFDAAVTRSTQSVAERRSKGAADDINQDQLYQQTIHGTSGVSRRPALFDIFKLRSRGEPKNKQGSIIQQVKAAVQNFARPPTPSMNDNSKEDVSDLEAPSSSASVKVKDGSAHPHAGSDAKYYHTVTASSSRRPSAMAKVMDIFRGRPSMPGSLTPGEGADRRKARAIAQHQQQYGSGAHLRRAASQEADKRRSSLGHLPAIRHRASDAFLDPHHAAMLFRDSRGLPVADPFLEKVSFADLEEDESQIFVKFFKFHKCYDLIPTSAKLVVFDTQLLVKKAFFALVYNGVRAAPLWDSQQQKFIGMLTITDFIKILQMYYTSPNVAMDELEEHRLETWRQVLKGSVMPLVSIGPDSSLFDAIKILVTNRIHRLPVIDPDTGNVLYILTHKRILRFLFLYINELPKPSYLQSKLRDLQIGTLRDIETANEDTSIIDALKKFVNRRVSALPLVDKEGRLKDIYAKFDVINLAAEKTYNDLEVSLKQANEHRNEWFEGVQKCTLDETLFDVMERIVRAEVHRLVVVDEEEKVIGIISLSDLLMYLVLRSSNDEEPETLGTCDSILEEKEESPEDTATSIELSIDLLNLE